MLRLGNVDIDPPLFLAPMAGVTDRDFRLIVKRIGGVGVISMEFLSSRGLVEGDPMVCEKLVYADEERPLAVQVYGSDPDTMAAAAQLVEERGADICDINMGCPANKILKGCSGAALMADLPLAEKIIRRVERAVSIPVTVKFRLGIDEGRQTFLELGRVCEANGVAAVTLHARTAAQGFRGQPRWSAITELRQLLSIPVIGNGDVRSADDACRMVRETGCDGVMIGRGATRNPWVFRQIADQLNVLERSGNRSPGSATDRAPQRVTLDAQHRLIRGHFATIIEREPARHAIHKLRVFTGHYSHGIPDGLLLRRQIQRFTDTSSFLDAIDQHFSSLSEPALSARALGVNR